MQSGARARPVVVVPLARWLLKIFFREIEVLGAERIPRQASVVFVANHANALIDPGLLLGFLPVRPRLLAKSTLWSNPAIRPFLRWAAAIPVYRRQDAGVDPAKNAETFAACHEVLAAAGAIALFPEGRSHNEPALVPLKTGVSRIVLEAEVKFGGLGTRIVPVGLTFDDKGRFRSRALIHVGEPLDPAAEAERFPDEPETAVRELTARVLEALATVTLNFPSWEEARLIERAAEIFETPTTELPSEPSLGDRFAVRKGFIEGYASLRERFPDEIAQVTAAVRAYDRLLRACDLRDVQVAAEYPSGQVARFVAKSLGRMLVRLPLALVGSMLHWLPYRAVGWTARRFADTPDAVATFKLFSSLVYFPLTWLLAAAVVGWWVGVVPALLTAGLGPLSAGFALRYHERREHFQRQARAFLLLRSGRRAIAELRRRRGEVLQAVRELAEVYRRQDAQP
ncbi:MAG: hypothetical protein GY856_21590 [bacterium]|nr:hypothetical protein [bacterium]